MYAKLADPHSGGKRLREVRRSDGKIILSENAWLCKNRNEDNSWRYSICLFDVDTPGSYTVVFEDLSAGPQPPVLQFIPDRERAEGQQIGFIVEASDPNGTIPALSAAPLPAGASFTDKGNGTAFFDWTPVTGQAGQYRITFRASDGELTASRSATLTVLGEDADGDAMPDYWEMKYFGTLDRDGTGDFDGDGISDRDEYLNNIDPTVMSGDVNQDEEIDLQDAVLCLQILGGITPEALVEKKADVNGDERIGAEDAIYILQFTGGLRK